MSLHWTVSSAEHSSVDNSCIVLHFDGELTRDTLLPLWKKYQSLINVKKEHVALITLDFSGINKLDSAGLVLICDIIHFYTKHYATQKVYLSNISPLMHDLALLYDLDEWLHSFIEKN